MGSFKLGKMTLKSVFKKPETVCYPAQEKPVPEGLKGTIANNMEACILCSLCARCCPAGAIEVDKKGGTWAINHFQCVQCGSCVRNCPKNCLSMLPVRISIGTKIESEVLHKPEESEEEKAAKEAAKQAKIEAAMKAKAQEESAQ